MHEHYIAGLGMRDIGIMGTCLMTTLTFIVSCIILLWLLLKRDPLWT